MVHRRRNLAEKFIDELSESGAVLPTEVAEIAIGFLMSVDERPEVTQQDRNPQPFRYEAVPAGQWAECELCCSQFETEEAIRDCHGYCPSCTGTSWHGITQRRVFV